MSAANEPAYPTPDSGGHWTNPETGYTGYQNPGKPGMTKREVMAMHVLAGWVSDSSMHNDQEHIRNATTFAVACADALLSELERTEKP